MSLTDAGFLGSHLENLGSTSNNALNLSGLSPLPLDPRFTFGPSLSSTSSSTSSIHTAHNTVQKPIVRRAKAPFDDPTADVILLSSDNVQFRIHKSILVAASPIFQKRFSTTPANGGNGHSHSRASSNSTVTNSSSSVGEIGDPCLAEEIVVSEPSPILSKFLHFLHPHGSRKIESLDDISTLSTLANTYEVESVLDLLRKMLLTSKALERDPVHIFVIAWRAEMWDVAREAMRRSAPFGIEHVFKPAHAVGNPGAGTRGKEKGSPDLSRDWVPPQVYKPLLEYHYRCGEVAQKTVEWFPWGDAEYCWFSSFGSSAGCTCEKIDTPDSWSFENPSAKARTTRWFFGYIRTLGAALYVRPSRKTIDVEAEDAKMFEGLECASCSARGAQDLEKFKDALGCLMNLAISLVNVAPS